MKKMMLMSVRQKRGRRKKRKVDGENECEPKRVESGRNAHFFRPINRKRRYKKEIKDQNPSDKQLGYRQNFFGGELSKGEGESQSLPSFINLQWSPAPSSTMVDF